MVKVSMKHRHAEFTHGHPHVKTDDLSSGRIGTLALGTKVLQKRIFL